MQFIKDLGEYLPPFTINDGTVSPEMTTDIEKLLNMLRSELIRAWEPITVSLKGAFLANITLQQPIFAGGRIVSGNKMAKIGVEMAEENNRLQKSNAIVEADKMYWLYISVKEKVKLAETYSGLLDNLVKMVSDAATTDMISNNDLMKVKVQRDKVKMELQKARSGLELTRMALCKTLGVSYDTQIVPTDTVVQTNEHIALTPPNALERRPEYQLMQKMIAIKEGEIKLVRGNYLPTIGMAASYAYVGGVKVQGKKTHPQNLSNVMATISIPITNWWEGSQKIKSARVDKNIAELEVEKNLKLIELEIKQAELNMTDAFTRINMCDEALEQTKENLRIMTDRYELE
ncbi:MAG TPA: TolC family protein, partial [Paludibacteraceae bacterium]|nr:TolC family protein [Paludibacteraceae bacterium]